MCDGAMANSPTSDWKLDDLTPAERALLGSVRGWRLASRPGSGLGVVQHAVKGAGLPLTTVLPLAALLGVLDLASTAHRPTLRCVPCRKVTEDEALLLDAVAAAQDDKEYAVREILSLWLEHDPTIAIAADRLSALASALAAAGAPFPGGRGHPTRPAFAMAAE